MIIVLKPHSTEVKIKEIADITQKLGYEPKIIKGVEHTVIAAVGDERKHQTLEILKSHPSVQTVLPIQKPYKLASREYHPKCSKVKIGDYYIGAGHFQVIAGPCAVESYEQMRKATKDVYKTGVRIIRGGAYKPRSSPYSFQGMGKEGLEILQAMKKEFGVAVITEVVGVTHIDLIAEVADCIQIGARNCQNYHLLEMAAKAEKPVLLKRGMSTTVNEWLSAAEYLLVNGCSSVILCERGIRTFETATRNTMDVGAIAVAKQESHFPVIADPSHAAGRVNLVLPLAKAAIGAGADGLIVEAHPDPVNASSDAAQQIKSSEFHKFMESIEPFIKICSQK
ncbi:MAG TPA: 3-deoxy-7-phosphoheptulonate synthase [Lentisphaeria bacterium]|nr:MAG: 3-deoxy-7-phosphoheptulonate synthase [Lentisphaerae bacterium GWF2_38_69]HBM16628.1 3-deoxy-7-phosphoheptulonate synthase [Lentisphaeria bacterium]